MECLSCTPKGCRFDSGEGSYLGCGFDPWLGHMQEAVNQYFSRRCLSVCLSPSLSHTNEYILGLKKVTLKKLENIVLRNDFIKIIDLIQKGFSLIIKNFLIAKSAW